MTTKVYVEGCLIGAINHNPHFSNRMVMQLLGFTYENYTWVRDGECYLDNELVFESDNGWQY